MKITNKNDCEDMYLVMQERKKIFDTIVNTAEKHIINKRYEIGARYIQIASRYASESHTGIFYSDKAEKLLNEISSKTIKKSENRNFNEDGSIEKVLHIATEVYDVGGHSRVIENWLGYDHRRVNDLVITNQLKKDCPSKLIKSLTEKGAKIIYLMEKHKRILQRAQILRQVSEKYDAIIMHIHPYDVVPIIALTNTTIPILFFNHADHRFWIGRNIATTFLEIRTHGKLLSNKKRGINPLNQEILPIPLKPLISISKFEARRSLGIGHDEVIVFSVASSYKYIPNQEGGINQIIIPLISKYSNLQVIVAGPDPTEKFWKDLYESSEGRVKAIGIQPFVDKYYIAADMYLDSYPISSLTSLLDAAKYGIPIFSINKGVTGLNLDDVALDRLDYKSKSIEELIERISYYIINIKEREDFGRTCSKEVNNYHIELGWVSLLNDIYKRLNSPFTKTDNFDGSIDIIEKYDFPLVHMHNKNKSLVYEYMSALNNNFEMLPLSERVKYIPLMFKYSFKEPVIFLKVITSTWLKSLIKALARISTLYIDK